MEQSTGHEARPCHGLASTWSTWTLKAALSDLFSGFSGNGKKKTDLLFPRLGIILLLLFLKQFILKQPSNHLCLAVFIRKNYNHFWFQVQGQKKFCAHRQGKLVSLTVPPVVYSCRVQVPLKYTRAHYQDNCLMYNEVKRQMHI